MVKDPVCGMEIDPKTAFATREHTGQTLCFCSKNCVDKFDADPHKYGLPPKWEAAHQPSKPSH